MKSAEDYIRKDVCGLNSKIASTAKDTITLCDLSVRFFCIDATLFCEFESDNIWINDLEKNRIR